MNILALSALTLVKLRVRWMTYLFWMIQKVLKMGSKQKKVRVFMLLVVETEAST
jgi:hypothetical protein